MKKNLLLLLVLSVLTLSAQTWKKISIINATKSGYSIYFIDKNNGFAGMDSKLYSTSDGGATWFEKTFLKFQHFLKEFRLSIMILVMLLVHQLLF